MRIGVGTALRSRILIGKKCDAIFQRLLKNSIQCSIFIRSLREILVSIGNGNLVKRADLIIVSIAQVDLTVGDFNQRMGIIHHRSTAFCT